MKKRIIALLICLLMVAGVFTACGNDQSSSASQPASVSAPDPDVSEPETPTGTGLTAGYFEYIMRPEGREEYLNYIHFYENGVYYFSAYNDGQYSAGYYELLDEPIEYPVDKDAPDGEKATAEQTIVFTDLNGTELARCGYANDSIYFVSFFYDNTFEHNPTADNNPDNETGVTVEEFMLEGDEYSTVLLKHNGTYLDSLVTIVEGTWAKNGDVYTLISDEGDEYTLTVNGDTAEYATPEGETMQLVRVVAATALMQFTGSTEEAAYGEMIVNIYAYEDGTAELVVSYGGQDNATKGTWVQQENYNLLFDFDGITQEAVLDTETRTYSMEYLGNDGVGDVTVLLEQVEVGGGERTVEMTFIGEENENIQLEMYSDGTCEMVYVGMGTMETGTWSMDDSSAMPVISITLDTTGEIEVETDYATKFFFTYETDQINETLAMPFG